MYTNIDTDTSIASIKQMIDGNKENIPPDFPIDLFPHILELVMKNNMFAGTAMGTPAACTYTAITYGQHKNSKILTEFSPYLLYYKRYIDDNCTIKDT
jgi:hypothetical protein